MQLSFTRLQLSIWLILAALLVFTQATSIPHPLRPRGNTRPGYPCSTNTDCELGLCDVFGNCATVCKLLALDQTCSGDDRECDQGVCGFDYSTPGRRMCALAADGDQCGRNADCASSSHCFNPQPGWVSAYEICLQDAQCGTNRCETDPDPDYAYVCRPYGKRCEFVKTCTISELGGACRLAADCDSMGCNGGTCSPTPVGGQCVTPIECRTNLCINGTCSARFGGDSCSLNDDCRSGICTIIQDDYGRCAKVAAGSTCLSNRDCLSNVCDLSHNTCLLPVGASCPLASACGSGICQNSVCSALPAKALCSANEDCISGNCGPEQPGCEGPRGCYSARSCQPSAIGSPCTVDTDCSKPGWCQGSQPFKTTGTCVAGTRPADDPTTSTIPSSTSTSTTTSATSSTTSSTTTTSATSSRRSTHDHKLADDHYAQLQFLDAHLNQEHDHHPQALGGRVRRQRRLLLWLLPQGPQERWGCAERHGCLRYEEGFGRVVLPERWLHQRHLQQDSGCVHVETARVLQFFFPGEGGGARVAFRHVAFVACSCWEVIVFLRHGNGLHGIVHSRAHQFR